MSRNADEDERFEVIGDVPGVNSETESPVTLRPNRFKPKAGVREKLRTVLQESLEDVEIEHERYNSNL